MNQRSQIIPQVCTVVGPSVILKVATAGRPWGGGICLWPMVQPLGSTSVAGSQHFHPNEPTFSNNPSSMYSSWAVCDFKSGDRWQAVGWRYLPLAHGSAT